MSAQIPSTMRMKDLLKPSGYDCPEELLDKTFEEATSGGDTKISTNTAATVDVSQYTEPVEITPAEGYDATKKVTLTLENIPQPSGDFEPFSCYLSTYDPFYILIAPLGSSLVGVENLNGDIVPFSDCYYSSPSSSLADNKPALVSSESDATQVYRLSPSGEHIYIPATLPAEDDPHSTDLYEISDGAFVLTEDTAVVEGKTYYEQWAFEEVNYLLSDPKGDLWEAQSNGSINRRS